MKTLLAGIFSVSAISTAFGSIPNGAIFLNDGDLREALLGDSKTLCGNISGAWTPGRLMHGYFLPLRNEIVNTRRAIKQTASIKKRHKLLKKFRLLRSEIPRKSSACNKQNPSTSPTTDPTPSSTGFYDIFGNLTEAGKTAYEVPQEFTANVSRGIAGWNATCFGCHNSSPAILRLKTFSAIKTRIAQPPMNLRIPQDVTEQKIADIVAYRNF